MGAPISMRHRLQTSQITWSALVSSACSLRCGP